MVVIIINRKTSLIKNNLILSTKDPDFTLSENYLSSIRIITAYYV